METTKQHFEDLSESIGHRLVWKYRRILRPQLVLSIDDNGPVVMEFLKRHPFSRRTIVMAADFEGMIEMRLTHPLWMEFVPLLGRWVHDYYRCSDRCGEQLAITGAVAKNPVSVSIAGTEFIYRRESLKSKRFLTIADEQGEIISGQDGKPEMAILRYVNKMPVVLAMYWLIRLCDWDGHG